MASSTERQRSGAAPIENIGEQYCPSAPTSVRSLYLEVRWRGGDVTGDVLEILDYGSGMASFTQTATIGDDRHLRLRRAGRARGGLDRPARERHDRRVQLAGADERRSHRTRHLRSPASFASTVKPTGFAGTSAASAVVAGGAALLLDADLAADPAVARQPDPARRDRPRPAGPDNAYGYGEFRLPAPPKPVDATPSVFVPLAAPQRVLDTRPESAIGPANLIGKFAAGEIRDLPVLGQAGVPTNGVTAVVVNVTAVDVDQPTYVQALPTWRASAGGYSNINTDHPAQTSANFAIVPIGDGGTISLYTIAAGHLVVDVLGYFTAATQPVGRRSLRRVGRRRNACSTRASTAYRSPIACRARCRAPAGRRHVAGAGAGDDRHRYRDDAAGLDPGLPDRPPGRHRRHVDGQPRAWHLGGQHRDHPGRRQRSLGRRLLRHRFRPRRDRRRRLHHLRSRAGRRQRTLRTGPPGAGVRLTHEHGRSHRRSADRDQCRPVCTRRRDRRGVELRRDQRPPARVRAGVGGGLRRNRRRRRSTGRCSARRERRP